MSEKLWLLEESIELAQNRGGCDRSVLCVMGDSRHGKASFFREFFRPQIMADTTTVFTRPPHFDPTSFDRYFRPDVSTLFLVEGPPFRNHQVTPFQFFETISRLIDGAPSSEVLRRNVVPVLMTTPHSYKFLIELPKEGEGEGDFKFSRNPRRENDLRSDLQDAQVLRWNTSYDQLENDFESLLASFQNRTARASLVFPEPLKRSA